MPNCKVKFGVMSEQEVVASIVGKTIAKVYLAPTGDRLEITFGDGQTLEVGMWEQPRDLSLNWLRDRR